MCVVVCDVDERVCVCCAWLFVYVCVCLRVCHLWMGVIMWLRDHVWRFVRVMERACVCVCVCVGVCVCDCV